MIEVKRLSGSEFQKRPKLKTKDQEQVVKKTMKIDSFFVNDKVCKENSNVNADKNEHVAKETDAQQSLEGNVSDNQLIDEVKTEHLSESIATKANDCTERIPHLDKDPAFWVLNDDT